MVCMGLVVCLQRHIKVLQYITAYERVEFLKHILTCLYCIKHNEINTSYSDVKYIYTYIYYKNGKNGFNFSCTRSYKRLCIHYVL